jgi:hypothetical protein
MFTSAPAFTKRAMPFPSAAMTPRHGTASKALRNDREDLSNAGSPGRLRPRFYLPTRGPTATRGGILALAREGERLGLHSAMIADHIVLPVESQSTYPYTLDGKHPSMGRCAGDFLHSRGGGRCNGAAAARHLRAGVALAQSGADRKDGGLAGRLVGRPADVRRRRRLAEGRIRSAEQPRFQCARRGDRRVDHNIQAPLVPVARPLQWPLLPILRYPL